MFLIFPSALLLRPCVVAIVSCADSTSYAINDAEGDVVSKPRAWLQLVKEQSETWVQMTKTVLDTGIDLFISFSGEMAFYSC